MGAWSLPLTAFQLHNVKRLLLVYHTQNAASSSIFNRKKKDTSFHLNMYELTQAEENRAEKYDTEYFESSTEK